MASDPKVDAYIAKAAPFAQPILTHLRALVHETIPGLDEALKWGMPHFLYKGKNLAGMSAFKAHAAFMIHGDGRQGDAMGQFGKIAALADLPGDNVLKSRLIEAKDRIDTAGTAQKPRTAPRAPRPELPIPPEFAAALDASPAARAALEGFAPSHRREYVEWITEAKRAETRDKRIAQAVEWLAQGKKRNWKYEGC
ncbi:MAG: YdeI/OmpD-associated family protein [Sphingomonadaceae bacterium]